MRVINISILAGLVLCGVSLWFGLSQKSPAAISFGVVGGVFAMTAAIAVFSVTLILFFIRVPSGQALPLLKQSGFVLVNFIGSLAAILLIFFSGINF